MDSNQRSMAEPCGTAPGAQVPAPLPYADASTPGTNGPARLDYTILTLATLQAGLALKYGLGGSGPGYYETDAAAWSTRAAWRLMDLEFLAASLFAISALAFVGATRPAYARRGWYCVALAALAVEALVWWAAAAILTDANFNFRWVGTYYGPPQPQPWTSFAFDPWLWWQGPVTILIFNPAGLILIVRRLLGRSLATGMTSRRADACDGLRRAD